MPRGSQFRDYIDFHEYFDGDTGSQPQFLSLEELIAAKLSTYLGTGAARLQDAADESKLIQANRLPREFGVDPKVREEYLKLWDAIHRSSRKIED